MRRFVFFAVALAFGLGGIVSAQQGGVNISVLPSLANPPNAPDGYLRSDQLAQKQVEGSLAFSTRNPLHGMAAFNDYRAVSIAEHGLGEQARFWSNPLQWLARAVFRTPQKPSVRAAAPEAWVGTSFTYDGITWSGGFVPGGPFDNSPASLASPVRAKGYQAATDPWVVSAPCGRFHVVFVPFTRFQGSAIAVANYVDNNNVDGKHTIEYLGTTLIETGNNATNGPFHDLPYAAVDPTRSTTGDACAYNLYVTWTTFSGNETTRVNFVRSADGGNSFAKTYVSTPAKTNQRAVIAIDPRPGTPKTTGGGTVYVGFRSFDTVNNNMWVARSDDYGDKFSQAVKLNGTPLFAFDQQTQPTSQYSIQETTFRSNAYMTLQAVPLSNGGMNLYAGWSERVNLTDCPVNGPQCGRPAANGEPRIVMMKSDAGAAVWTDLGGAVGQRRAVDFADRDTEPNPNPTLGYLYQPRGSGAQLQPHFTFAEGRFGLLYLESRSPLVGSAGIIAGLDPNAPSGDWRGPQIDARFAILDPATGGLLGTSQISRYPVKADAPANAVNTLAGIAEVITGSPSKQVNYKSTFPNSGGGTSPFIGDYTAVAPVLQFVLDKQTNRWRWATQPGDQPYPGFHAMWADSRHLLPPSGTPVDQAGKSPNFNAGISPMCSADLGGSRNHDIKTTLVNTSVLISAPTTFKVGPIQRAFPITVTNSAKTSTFFRLTLSAPLIGSFNQTDPTVDQLDLELLPYSSATPVVYIDATATSSETVTVAELDLSGCPAPQSLSTCANPPVKLGGQTGSVTLNLDPTNPQFQGNAGANTEKHNPLVTAPLVTAPLVTAPLVTAPMVTAPLVTASGQQAPLVTAPLVTAPLVTASAPADWDGQNVTQYTWTVTGDADTVNSGQYAQLFLDNGAALANAYGSELRIFRRTSHTMVVPDPANPGKCLTISVPQEELISSIPSPLVTAPLVTAPFVGDNAKNPLVTAATFVASPPDESNTGSNALAAVAPGPTASLTVAGSSPSAAAKKKPLSAPLPAGGRDLRDSRDNRTYVSLLFYWRNGTTTPPQISTPAIALVPISGNIVEGVGPFPPEVTFLAPDLIVNGTLFSPSMVERGGQFQLSWTLKNDGNRSASAADGAFTNAYYLSADSIVDGGDLLLGTDDQTTALAPGATNTFTKLLTIPLGTPAGDYRLLIRVDSGSEISESKEPNNFVDAGPLTVIAPDLIVSATPAPAFTPSSVNLTGQTTLTWVLKNAGNAGASAPDGTFRSSYYLSPDSTVDGTDTLLGINETTPGLAPGATQTFTKALTIPPSVTPGGYRLLIKVDSLGEVSESNEANNVADAGPLTVTARPGTLFIASDEEDFTGVSPDRIGRFVTSGKTVTSSSIVNTNNGDGSFAINGLADAGGFLFTGDPFTNTLRKVDYDGNLLGSMTMADMAPLPPWNEDFAFDGTTFYQARYNGSGGQIAKINPATGERLATYPSPCAGAAVASAPIGITFAGNQLWISCWEAQQVGTWNPATNTFTPKFTVGTYAGGLAYDAANGILWVARLTGWVEPFDVDGNLLGPGFQPFGPMANTIDGLEFIPAGNTQINFESPFLGESSRQQINPYTAGGVTFTADPSGGFDGVVGLVKNNSTSACVPPANANQLLGTAPSVDGSIGLSGFPIRATFADGGIVGPRTISVDAQALSTATVQLRLYDSANTLLATATANPPPIGDCGFPGGPRGKVTLSAWVAGGTVAYAVIHTNTGAVLVIDNFKIR